MSVFLISDLGWSSEELAGSFTKLECTWNVSQVVLHTLRTTVLTNGSTGLCSDGGAPWSSPASAETLILMPIEHYTKELTD